MSTATAQANHPHPRHLVIGAGGLGCPALLGLVAGGATRITVVDDDVVDASNLQRQVLYATYDVGVPKARAAVRRLRSQAPRDAQVDLRAIEARLDGRTLAALLDELAPGSVVLECTDNPGLKFATNDACVARGIPLVVGGVLGWEGQVMVVGDGTCYRCLYEREPPRELAPACAEAGVIGAACGHLGWLMAAHAHKLAAGDDSAAGTLTTFDGRTLAPRTLSPRPRPDCPACARRESDGPRSAHMLRHETNPEETSLATGHLDRSSTQET